MRWRELLVALLCACNGRGARGVHPAGSAPTEKASPTVEPPAPWSAADLDGQALVLTARSDVPLKGPEIPVEAGDFMLRSERAVAVISVKTGDVLAFGAPDGLTGIERFGPAAFDDFRELEGEIESIAPALGGRAIHLHKRLFAQPLVIDAWIGLSGSTLLLRWSLQASGDILAITPGEELWWGNTPTWVEGHGFVTTAGSFSGEIMARESLGLAYAFCRMGARVTGRFAAIETPGFFRSARTGEERIALKKGQTSALRSVAMSFGGSMSDALFALPCKPAVRPTKFPQGTKPPNARAQVSHCESERAYAARKERAADGKAPVERGPGAPFLLAAPGEVVLLPAGCARMRFTSPGLAPGPWFDPDEEARLLSPDSYPRAGALAWRIRDAGGALPAAIVVRGVGATADPDWGDHDAIDHGTAARNFIYTSGTGSIAIAPGKYRVIVHRGPEYTIVEKEIAIEDGKKAKIDATLDRVVDTKGWISADLHVHALPSFDAPTLLEDRVRALAAVGVEVAVATDHNAVTDYAPAIGKLGLATWVTSIVGDEITTEEPRLGHFNAFPLPPGSPPIAFQGQTPARLFAAARQAIGEGGVLQLNHPRMGQIGYFELFHFDPGALDEWAKRSPLAPLGFDAVEIFNGDHYSDAAKLEPILRDWYALLDAGVRITATGNSDSHRIAYQEAGMPRNFVRVDNDDPGKLDKAAFLAAIRAGHVVISSGPFVDFRIGSAGPGDEVAAGELSARVRVDAPPWMDVSEIDIVRRGEVIRHDPVQGRAKPRFDETIALRAEAGDWLLCIARGEKPMRQLYRAGALPFAITNPIRVR